MFQAHQLLQWHKGLVVCTGSHEGLDIPQDVEPVPTCASTQSGGRQGDDMVRRADDQRRYRLIPGAAPSCATAAACQDTSHQAAACYDDASLDHRRHPPDRPSLHCTLRTVRIPPGSGRCKLVAEPSSPPLAASADMVTSELAEGPARSTLALAFKEMAAVYDPPSCVCNRFMERWRGETEMPLTFRSALLSLAQAAFPKMKAAGIDSLVLDRLLWLAQDFGGERARPSLCCNGQRRRSGACCRSAMEARLASTLPSSSGLYSWYLLQLRAPGTHRCGVPGAALWTLRAAFHVFMSAIDCKGSPGESRGAKEESVICSRCHTECDRCSMLSATTGAACPSTSGTTLITGRDGEGGVAQRSCGSTKMAATGGAAATAPKTPEGGPGHPHSATHPEAFPGLQTT
ncbi:unnamed protein product [Lampetra fluviatilis]